MKRHHQHLVSETNLPPQVFANPIPSVSSAFTRRHVMHVVRLPSVDLEMTFPVNPPAARVVSVSV